MSQKTESSSQIVKNIGDFDLLLEVCKKHNLSSLKLGDIEFTLILKDGAPALTRSSELSADDVNMLTYEHYNKV